jgi:beta-galactosidase/beta-glucuronidase
MWQYAVRPRIDAMPTSWDGQILVPFCIESRLSGVQRRLLPSERLWYRRTFVPTTFDQRTLLHFGAVDYHAALWLNGAYVAAHSGGFDPFTVDITEYLCPGHNTLTVAVDDPTNGADQPRGKQHLTPRDI